MEQALFRTITLPNAIAGQQATVIAQGTAVPVRVAVRNVSAALIYIAASSQDIVGPGGAGSQAFRIAPGQGEVFVIAPRQQLFAGAAGVNGLVSVAISEALPLV